MAKRKNILPQKPNAISKSNDVQIKDEKSASKLKSFISDDCCPLNSICLEVQHPKAVYLARNFFSADECQAWIDLFNSASKMDYVSHPASRSIAQRECYRWHLDDWTLSHQIFQRIRTAKLLEGLDFGFSRGEYPITCNGNLRLYKYDKGMSFGRHIDESNRTDHGITRVTVLIYLSDCQGGGATRFHVTRKQSFAVSPVQGSILFHVHGDQCLEHEGDPVIRGTKYVLRTDLVYSSIIL
jgi:2OG-Fe(II) oxygenase superfamily